MWNTLCLFVIGFYFHFWLWHFGKYIHAYIHIYVYSKMHSFIFNTITMMSIQTMDAMILIYDKNTEYLLVNLWLFQYPPGPCRVERTDGTELYSYQCPNDLECNVGAVTYRFDNNNLRFSACNYPARFFVSIHLFFTSNIICLNYFS